MGICDISGCVVVDIPVHLPTRIDSDGPHRWVVLAIVVMVEGTSAAGCFHQSDCRRCHSRYWGRAHIRASNRHLVFLFVALGGVRLYGAGCVFNGPTRAAFWTKWQKRGTAHVERGLCHSRRNGYTHHCDFQGPTDYYYGGAADELFSTHSRLHLAYCAGYSCGTGMGLF